METVTVLKDTRNVTTHLVLFLSELKDQLEKFGV